MSTLEAGVPLANLAELIHAANVLGHQAWDTSAIEERNWMAANEDALRKDLADLFALIHDRRIDYLLVGGVALLTYVEGRNTKDVDLVLSLDSLAQLPEIIVNERNNDFARGRFRDLRVDVLLSANPLFKRVQERYATMHRFLEMEVRCATVEGLVLLKLYALPSLYLQGEGQRIGIYENDIFMLMERYRPDLGPLFDVLKDYIDVKPLAELRNIVGDIQRRIDRIDRARNRK